MALKHPKTTANIYQFHAFQRFFVHSYDIGDNVSGESREVELGDSEGHFRRR